MLHPGAVGLRHEPKLTSPPSSTMEPLLPITLQPVGKLRHRQWTQLKLIHRPQFKVSVFIRDKVSISCVFSLELFKGAGKS